MPKFNKGDVVMGLERGRLVWGVIVKCGEARANVAVAGSFWEGYKDIPAPNKIEELRSKILNGTYNYSGSFSPREISPYVADAFRFAMNAKAKLDALESVHAKERDELRKKQVLEGRPLRYELDHALGLEPRAEEAIS